jgi:cytochrome c-type biogenesis protein CcsB
MSKRTRVVVFDVAVLALLAYVIVPRVAGMLARPTLSAFAERVDLEPLQRIAVQRGGRLVSLDSYTRGLMRAISGPRQVNGQPGAYTYLDLMLRPAAYQSADLIYVGKKPVRQRIAQVLAADPQIPQERLDRFNKSGLISMELLMRPQVTELLTTLRTDVLRTSKAIDEIATSMNLSAPEELAASLLVVPPADGDPMGRWLPIQMVTGAGAPADAAHARLGGGVQGLDPAVQRLVADAWTRLAVNWRQQTAESAAAASAALRDLAEFLPQLNPALYPAGDKLRWESWYVRWHGLVWNWIVYLLAIVFLLMAVIYNWPRARVAGLLIFGVAFAIHTFSIGLRWYLAERIPNSNMFEAIMAASWFGGVAALVIELLVRRTPMRNLFVLGASACAMTAMMCSHFMPVTLDRSIQHIMPVLHDVWLYIHTNVIIFSYCLIGMAAVTALLYLRHRLGGGGRDYARAGGAGELILASAPGNSFLKAARPSSGAVLDGATMVLMELSFVLLWAGIVMGAIWADHSWGRPWGWDPKEVFALNTFIVFLLLVHVRLKVRDKGLWTAVLACAGCAVMLFNWIVINFVIAGLHSYA